MWKGKFAEGKAKIDRKDGDAEPDSRGAMGTHRENQIQDHLWLPLMLGREEVLSTLSILSTTALEETRIQRNNIVKSPSNRSKYRSHMYNAKSGIVKPLTSILRPIRSVTSRIYYTSRTLGGWELI